MLSPLVLGSMGLAVMALLVATLMQTRRRLDADRVGFVLTFPRDVTAANLVVLMRSLGGLGVGSEVVARSLVFEVVARSSGIEHRLYIPQPWVGMVRTQLLTVLPALALQPLAASEPLPFNRGVELKLTGDAATLRADTAQTHARQMLAALTPVRSDEALMLQWVVAPAGTGPAPTTPVTRQRTSHSWPVHLLLALWRSPAANSERVSLATQRAKTSEPLFRVVGRIVALSRSAVDAGHLVGRVRAALASVEAPGATFSQRSLTSSQVVKAAQSRRTPQWWAIPLNAAELAAVVAWPIGGPVLPGLTISRTRWFPVPAELPATGRILGDGTTGGGSRAVAQSLASALTHTWVLGKTGAGKSTLLANLITQDIADPARPGVVLIEPKGDLVSDILPRIPEHRWDDVILLDPASEVLVGLNPLRLDEPDRELVADEVYGVIQQLSTSWGPRLGDVLYNSLQTLARQPDATLAELPLLLGDDGYRRRALARLGEEGWVLRAFWAGYDSLSPAERATVAAPILTRVRPWVTRARLRHLIGVPMPRWSFREVFDQGRILLVSLNTGLLGTETVRLLGSLIFQSLRAAATSRAAIPNGQRRPVLVYADEWQDYTHIPTALDTMLSQARGYGMGLILANQSTTQLSTDLRSAVTVHARSKIVMAGGFADSSHLAREIGGGVTAEDLQGLGAHEAIASLMVGAQTAPPVSLKTRPLPEAVADPVDVHNHVQQTYGLDRVQVERDLQHRHLPPQAGSPTHKRRRPS